MIKTIYFDLGNVLIFFSRSKMIQQISDCTGLDSSQLQQFFFNSPLFEQYETGVIDTAEIYRLFSARSPRSFSLQELVKAASDIFTPNTELWPLVEKLKGKVRLVLLSNISECHYNWVFSRYPILHAFDHKILSFEVGAMKPNPLIFQKALAHAHCSPEECFYIDDIPEFIDSARKSGLNGELYTDVASLRRLLNSHDLKI